MTQDFFATAYRNGFEATVRFLLCKGALVEEAEEQAQAAWARGWEARDQLQNLDRVLPWVNSIAFHKFCNERRRSGRHDELKETADRAAGQTKTAAKIDVQNLMTHCSSVDRSLLIDRYYRGMDIREIAKRHGLSAVAARVRLHRCKKSLRKFAENGEPQTSHAIVVTTIRSTGDTRLGRAA